MAATYTDIPACDLDAFLTSRGFSVIPSGPKAADAKSGGLAGTRETVYGRLRGKGHPTVSVRVYTGIESGVQRGCGDDAIRIVMVTRTKVGDIKTIHTMKRVHRVSGWKRNLASRIEESATVHFPLCPKCGYVMAERRSKTGAFYGCVNYPECTGRRRINEDCPMI